MRYLVLSLVFVLAACAAKTPAPTAEAPAAPAVLATGPVPVDTRHFTYLSLETVPADFLPPPPAVGSTVDVADVKAVRAWEAKRTPKLCAEVEAQKAANPREFFPKFPLAKNDAEEAFFQRIRADVSLAVDVYKKKFLRPRPYLRPDVKITACYPENRGTSYPSGHATIAEVYARILGELVPARRAEFNRDALKAAEYRVIGGVHHPSDVKAGARLGDELYRLLNQSEAFRRDLAALRPQP